MVYYRFGPFVLDPASRLLLREEQPVPITTKVFETLVVLVENRGRVMTKDELLLRLWPDTTVEEANLAQNVSSLRRALEDNPKDHRYIATIPGRGYSFVAVVTEISKQQNIAESSANELISHRVSTESALGDLHATDKAIGLREVDFFATPANGKIVEAKANPLAQIDRLVISSNQLIEEVPPTKAKRRPLYFGLAILGVAVATAATLPLWRAAFRPPSPPKVLRFTRLTNDGQGKFGPMATDGSRIYFNELLPGPRNLVVQVSVKGGEATSLSVPLALPVMLDLSRDGTELLVADSANEGGIQFQVGNGMFAIEGFEPQTLWVLPVAGGSPHRIGTILGADARFGPSTTSIIYAIGHDISSVSEDGSFSRKILSIGDNEGGVRSTPLAFRFSPDARVFRFTQYDFSSVVENLTIMEAAADGAGLHKMFAGCCGEWTPDGRYFIFQDRHEGRFDLWAVREERRLWWRKRDDKPIQLTAGPLDFRFPLPSKDGKEIFAIGTSRRTELFRFDAHTSQFAPFLSGISAEHVAFSRDGQWVTYIIYPEGTLWRCRVDGSERIQLTFPPLQVVLPRWSPDGKQIAFNAKLPGKSWNIYLISRDGGTAQRILPSEQFQMDANWSPDGKSLLFGSLRIRNAPIYTIDLMTKCVSALPGSSGFFSPRWSPDGRHIAAITMAHRTLMLFDLSTQKWTEAFGSEMGWEQWSHDGRYIYFSDYNPAQELHPRVVRLRLSDGKIENIVDLQKAGRLTAGSFGAWFGLAPDDSLLFARNISTQEIYALEVDWP
jgi:DNA-binding winged helix-turn-helix (wHTH) protein/Tol biopolymer transport system component